MSRLYPCTYPWETKSLFPRFTLGSRKLRRRESSRESRMRAFPFILCHVLCSPREQSVLDSLPPNVETPHQILFLDISCGIHSSGSWQQMAREPPRVRNYWPSRPNWAGRMIDWIGQSVFVWFCVRLNLNAFRHCIHTIFLAVGQRPHHSLLSYTQIIPMFNSCLVPVGIQEPSGPHVNLTPFIELASVFQLGPTGTGLRLG